MKSIFKSKIFWAQIAIIAGAVFLYFTTSDPGIKFAQIGIIITAIGAIVARITSKPTKLYVKKPKPTL